MEQADEESENESESDDCKVAEPKRSKVDIVNLENLNAKLEKAEDAPQPKPVPQPAPTSSI